MQPVHMYVRNVRPRLDLALQTRPPAVVSRHSRRIPLRQTQIVPQIHHQSVPGLDPEGGARHSALVGPDVERRGQRAGLGDSGGYSEGGAQLAVAGAPVLRGFEGLGEGRQGQASQRLVGWVGSGGEGWVGGGDVDGHASV